ncbi:MAG: hypothetical protein P8Y18_10480 [Candidatus Bathyarchaeota archaeon]
MNKLDFFFSVILFVLLINISFVSVGFSLVIWSKNYGGVGDQKAVSIIETSDGGYAIFGNTQIEPNLSDFLLIKIDADGNMQWNQTYDGKGETDLARSFVQTSDGGYALAGQTFSSFQYGSSDLWLIKTDYQGNMQWNKTYGQWYMDDLGSVIETSDGGFALFGTTLSIVGKLEDYFLVKTNSFGNLMWNKTYGRGDRREFGEAIVQTSDEGYVLAGSFEISGFSRTAYQLLKIDTLGNMKWNQTYDYKEFEINYYLKVTDLVTTADGGFALGGTTRSAWTDFEAYYLFVKTDEFGNMQWNQTYRTANSNDKQTAMVGTSDGGFAIASSYRNESTYSDVWLIKTNINGVVEWNQNHSMIDFQYVRSIIQTSDGGFALAGRTHSSEDEYQTNDFLVIKTDEQGIPEFPTWTILPIMLVSSFVVIIVRKKFVRKG